MHSGPYTFRKGIVMGRVLRRNVFLAVALTICVSVLTASSAAAANFTWSGGAPHGEPKWSNGANWGGTTPSGAVGTLTFPELAGTCATEHPTATCYESEADLAGLSVTALDVEDGSPYRITGNGFTLGSGGLTASTTKTNGAGGMYIETPIALSSPQTWAVGQSMFATGDGVSLAGPVTGSGDALDINLSNGAVGFLEAEVGPVEIKGTGYIEVFGDFCCEPARLNATDRNPIVLKEGARISGGHGILGPLSLSSSASLQIGIDESAATMTVEGAVTFDSTSGYEGFISNAGFDAEELGYSQLKVNGAVNLGGATLTLSGREFTEPGPGHCPSLEPGEIDTLVNATGLVSGTFKGISDGAIVTLECLTGTKPTLRINYTEHTVTATVVTGGPPSAPRELRQPEISGQAQEGQVLTLTKAGTWLHNPTGRSYEWERCDPEQIHCEAIAGATGTSYSLTAADVGSVIRVGERATNGVGTSHYTSYSEITGVVVQAAPSGGGGQGGNGGSSTVAQTASVSPKGEPVPVPVVSQRQTVTATAGTVTIRVKGASTFVSLSGSTSIPDGSEVEATNGRVVITAATPTGKTVSAEVYGGRFRVHQTSSGETLFILTLPLTGCPRAVLPRGSAAALASAAKGHSGPKSRHLWVSEKEGSWGTDGRYVSTSVEGTTWLTLDECTRSEVKVTAGKVKVLDLVRRKTKKVSAGHSYVATAQRRHRA